MPPKVLQPLISVSGSYRQYIKDTQTASVNVCHLAPDESTGATSSVTRRQTGLVRSFYIQIVHSLQTLDSLLWFYSLVTTLRQPFFP